MNRISCALLGAVFAFAACGTPVSEPTTDGGRPDSGGLPTKYDAGIKCAQDDGGCWQAFTYCESAPCSYHFDYESGFCGSARINFTCLCATLSDGGFTPYCTGGCLPDSERICITPNCGNVTCAGKCVAYGVCG
jgi:hypothetical protein